MKDSFLICALPENIPAFICNQNGSIVLLNDLAEKAFGKRLYGKNITELLSCKGKLQFEIAMKSKTLRPFTDEADFASGYPYFYVVPGKISFDRFATVVVLQNNQDFSPDYSPMPVETLNRVINALLSLDFNKIAEYDDGIFDAKKAVSHITDHLNNSSFLPNKTVFSDYHKKAENYTYICDCPLQSFTSLLCALAYITDSFSSCGDAAIELSYYETIFEIKLRTKTYLNSFTIGYDSVVSLAPSCKAAADICSFIAERNNFKLDANCNGDEITFTVTFNYPDFSADFKSNDPFKSFEGMFEEICNHIMAIYKEEEQV